MKKSRLYRQSSLFKNSLLIAAPFIFTQSVWAVITIDFAETTAGVRVTFDGTLNTVTLTDTTTSDFDDGGVIADAIIVARNGSTFSNVGVGAASPSGLPFDITASAQPGDVGFFGFNGDILFWESIHIAPSQLPGSVTQLNVSPSNAAFTIPGETLSSLGVDNLADGTVLWTANVTNDTFIFSATPIPEPSSSLLITFSSLALLRRKR